jgi:Na+-driven multidrug efflux pump
VVVQSAGCAGDIVRIDAQLLPCHILVFACPACFGSVVLLYSRGWKTGIGYAGANLRRDWQYSAGCALYCLFWLGNDRCCVGNGVVAIAATIHSMLLLPARMLQFNLWQKDWREVLHAAFNGVSEFINEISGGLVILLVNWLLVTRLGVDGVAAFTVINYLLFACLMIFYGIADAMQLLVAQNFGARNTLRIRQFMQTSVMTVVTLGSVLIVALFLWREQLIRGFLNADDRAVIDMAANFVLLVWPIFMVNGLNVLLSSYLTAIHKPAASASIALLRSLILPIVFLCALFWWFPHQPILTALPLAEWITFVVAIILYWRFRPVKLFDEII